MAQTEKNELPLACDMGVLTPEERDRRVAVFGDLQGATIRREELPDGLRLHLRPDGDVLRTVVEFIDGERRCCPFFAFSVRLEPESAGLWLDLTGPEGVRKFIGEEFPNLP